MRGYKCLRNDHQLDLVAQLVDVLSKTELRKVSVSRTLTSSNSLFDIELSARQYLTVRLLSLSFNKAILHSIGSNKALKHPLPREWRNALTEQNIQVNHFACSLLWVGYTTMLWGYGVFEVVKSVYSLIRSQSTTLGSYVYFQGLNENNISSSKDDHNIINWYLQWKNKSKNIDAIGHSVKCIPKFRHQNLNISYMERLPYINGINRVYYIFWLVYLILHSALFFLFNPYPGVLLSEMVKLIRVKLADKNQLAKDYIFHNSGILYRPLWTYEAEVKKSRIILYFYGTNIENFKSKDGYRVTWPYHLITWPHLLVWNKYQANFINRFDHCSPIVEEVGVIWFSTKDIEISSPPKNSIAVFDVEAVRTSFYRILGASIELYVPSISNQFLSDIQEVAEQNNLIMMHKRKRKISHKLVHKKYLQNLKQLQKKENYIEIDPDLDATLLIKKTLSSISMPFTSTAHIAQSEGRPSVYYDPSGLIQKNDTAAHGIPILTGISELKEWVKNIDK
tara:strand:- start:732 stop:2252 length:1521 start_codon:yes stop_codon:yes gene_type:complete